MASTTVSTGMSFSRSTASAVMSMFTAAPLSLNSTWITAFETVSSSMVSRPLPVSTTGRGPVDGQDASGERRAVSRRDRARADRRASPVAHLGERPVDTGRGHLEDVGARHELLVIVEETADRTAGIGDTVEVHTAVAIDDDANDAARTGLGHRDVLQIESGVREHGVQRLGEPVPVAEALEPLLVTILPPPCEVVVVLCGGALCCTAAMGTASPPREASGPEGTTRGAPLTNHELAPLG